MSARKKAPKRAPKKPSERPERIVLADRLHDLEAELTVACRDCLTSRVSQVHTAYIIGKATETLAKVERYLREVTK